MPVVEPWERQPSEGSKAFAAFQTYRDMEPAVRSLARVAESFGRSASLMHQWSARWMWLGRSRAWDQEQDRAKRAATIKSVEDMGRRHVSLSLMMQKLGADRINTMTDDEKKSLSIWEITRLLETGTRLERVARGVVGDEPTNIPIQIPQPLNLVAFLRANPNRVGPVLDALVRLREAAPELLARNVTPDVPDVSDDDLSDEDEEEDEP